MLGFKNSGATCWFNSSLQLLLHVPQIANMLRNDMLTKILYNKRKNACDFTMELSQLAKVYWNSTDYESSVGVTKIHEIFAKINRNFAGKRQYDATESFLAMINTLETSMVQRNLDVEHPIPFGDANVDQWNEYSKRNWKTFLSDVFLGQVKQTYKDSITYEHFTGLVIYPSKTLEQGIQNYISDGEITRQFTRLPLILPIIFQKSSDKEFVFYDADLYIDDVKYVLFGILLHEGNENSGHWIAMCSNNDVWNRFDDEGIERIYDMNTLVHKNAMLLMYKRIV
jgi:ubiquitin C-terminal hydrolase